MRIATSYVDLSGRCQIRPISDVDFERLSIPRLPADALTWLYQNPDPMGIGGLLRVAGKPVEADIFLLMQSDKYLRTDGARMLRFLLGQAKRLGFMRLVAVCDSPQTAYARLLAQIGFRTSYEEWDMWCSLAQFDTSTPQRQLETFPESKGAALIRRMYADSFADKPWYLPYTSDSHLLDEFGINSDLLFLFEQGEPVGFAGVRYEGTSAEVEIFGIVESHQSGHLGHALMGALLHRLAVTGYENVNLSIWKENLDGLRLAQAFNFHRVQTRVYLDLNLVA